MSATYNTVQIGGNDYPVYADIATATLYLQADPSSTAFFALDAEQQAQYLVAATRVLDRQAWLGEKTDPDQDLQWPRKNTGVPGVEDDVIPLDIIDAACELTNAMVNGYDAANQQSTETGAQKRLKAGSVEIEYFLNTTDFALRFPLPVTELIGKYLGSAASPAIDGSAAYGTCKPSMTRDHFGFTEGI